MLVCLPDRRNKHEYPTPKEGGSLALTLSLVAQFEEKGEEPEIRVIDTAVDGETHPERDFSLPFQAARSYNLLTAIHPL